MKYRTYYLDVIRCFACMMVVLMHAPYPKGGLSGNIVVPISLFTAPCIGLFFMVSGSLLLPTKDEGLAFLKKRLSKILVPTIFWMFFGICCNSLLNGWGRTESLRIICSIPFSAQGHGVLWFMYALIGLYLIAPVISPWLEKCQQSELRFYLILWILTLCFPFLNMLVEVNETITGTFYYIQGFIGYFVLGYYLKRYGNGNTIIAVLWIPIPFLFLGIAKKYGFPFSLGTHFWTLSLPTLISSWSWFTIFKNLDAKIIALSPSKKNILTHFSNCTFGIYLMHIFIMRNGLWPLFDQFHIEGYASLIISFIGTLVISYLLCLIISFCPFGNYIIGYKQKQNFI